MLLRGQQDTRNKWIQTDDCTSKNAPGPLAGQQSHMKTTYSCSKAAVTWIAHGGGHVPDPSGTNGLKTLVNIRNIQLWAQRA